MTRKLEELFDLPISETADTEEPVVETPAPVREPVIVESPNAPGLDASDERPGDYLTPAETPPEPTRIPEAAPPRATKRAVPTSLT